MDNIDFANIINIGNSYADHLGIAEDVIKQGAQLGLIDNSKAKRVLRMLAAQGESPNGRTPLFAADVLAAPAIMENPIHSWIGSMQLTGKELKSNKQQMHSQVHMVTTVTLFHLLQQQVKICL